MNVTVRLFAAARDAAGASSFTADLCAGATVEHAVAAAAAAHPGLSRVLPTCRFAVDEEFAPRSAALRDGQTVAVLPPVSGG